MAARRVAPHVRVDDGGHLLTKTVSGLAVAAAASDLASPRYSEECNHNEVLHS